MDLNSFLASARRLVDAEDLFPHASGFRTALAGANILPVYDTNEAWEADFREACRPPRDTLTQPYAIYVRASIAEFLTANPHIHETE